MKRILSLCIFIFLVVCIPISIIADVDPTPYPESLIESVLGQYTNCSWEIEGMAYYFTGTPFDGDIFATRYDGEDYILTILNVENGQVCNSQESETALFQEPVKEFYCEVDDEIWIFFESGAELCYQKQTDQQWKLKSYAICDEGGGSFIVSLFDGPITFYQYENPLTGESQSDRLCGLLCFDPAFESVDVGKLPDSIHTLQNRIISDTPSESYMMAVMDVEDIPYYASCRLHEGKADIRIYAEDEIVRFDEDQVLRVTGFDLYVDNEQQEKIYRKYNAKYDFYYGNMDACINISADSKEITLIPCWDDGSTDLTYSFVFPIE